MLKEDACAMKRDFTRDELHGLDVFFCPSVKYLFQEDRDIPQDFPGAFRTFLNEVVGEGPLPHYPSGRMALKMEPAGNTGSSKQLIMFEREGSGFVCMRSWAMMLSSWTQT